MKILDDLIEKVTKALPKPAPPKPNYWTKAKVDVMVKDMALIKNSIRYIGRKMDEEQAKMVDLIQAINGLSNRLDTCTRELKKLPEQIMSQPLLQMVQAADPQRSNESDDQYKARIQGMVARVVRGLSE